MKEITIVVPARNEEKRIAACADSLPSSKFISQHANLIFVIDGTDNTAKILEELKKRKEASFEIHSYDSRLGKGGAVEEGFRLAKTGFVGYLDADTSIGVGKLEQLLRKLLEEKPAALIAVRKRIRGRGALRSLAARAFNAYANLLFNLGISDTQCGCKFFERKAIVPLLPLCTKGFAFDVELLWRLKKSGAPIRQFPLETEEKQGGTFGPLDAPRMFWDLLLTRFT